MQRKEFIIYWCHKLSAKHSLYECGTAAGGGTAATTVSALLFSFLFISFASGAIRLIHGCPFVFRSIVIFYANAKNTLPLPTCRPPKEITHLYFC